MIDLKSGIGSGVGGGNGADGSSAFNIEPVGFGDIVTVPDLDPAHVPEVIRNYATVIALNHDVPMGAVAFAMLCVCAGVTTDAIKVRMKSNSSEWTERACIWNVICAPPSSTKSAIIDAAVAPASAINKRLTQTSWNALQSYNALPKAAKAAAKKPPWHQLIISDVTTEKAGELMADNPRGMLMVRNEASAWLSDMDRYHAGGKGSDRQFHIAAWDGCELTINRILRGHLYIENVSQCLLGGIQPELLRTAITQQDDDGLMQRITPTLLRASGKPEANLPTASQREAYAAIVERLFQLTAPPALGGGTDLLTFDPQAQATRDAFSTWCRDHAEKWAGIRAQIGAAVRKLDRIYGRLCVVLHCIEQAERHLSNGGEVSAFPTPRIVPLHIAEMATNFTQKFVLPHLVGTWVEILNISGGDDKVRRLQEHVLSKGLMSVTARDVYHSNLLGRGLDRRKVEPILEQLESLGWLVRNPANVRSSSSAWLVNPLVHSRFEAAAAEARVRAKAHQDLLSAVYGQPKDARTVGAA
jgi:hypothetical protein